MDSKSDKYVMGKEYKLKTLSELGFSRTGYIFKGWSRSGTTQLIEDGGKLTIDTDAIEITANWEISKYVITTSVDPSGSGTVDGGGTYDYGTSVTLTATASTGYHFVKWNDDDTNASRTITVSGNATYIAMFMQPIEIFKLKGYLVGRPSSGVRKYGEPNSTNITWQSSSGELDTFNRTGTIELEPGIYEIELRGGAGGGGTCDAGTAYCHKGAYCKFEYTTLTKVTKQYTIGYSLSGQIGSGSSGKAENNWYGGQGSDSSFLGIICGGSKGGTVPKGATSGGQLGTDGFCDTLNKETGVRILEEHDGDQTNKVSLKAGTTSGSAYNEENYGSFYFLKIVKIA